MYLLAFIAAVWALFRVDARDFKQASILIVASVVFTVAGYLGDRGDA